jgi:hypothetical protein
MNDALQNYYERKAVSQSALKALHRGVDFYKREQKYYFKEEPHWVIGDGVDCLLTRPNDFDAEFYISSYERKPGKGALSIGRYVWDNLDKEHRVNTISLVIPYFTDLLTLGEFPDLVDYMEIADDLSIISGFMKEVFEIDGYGGDTWSLERKVKTCMKAIIPYWKDLVEANGRQIISNKELETIKRIAEIFVTHPHTAPFLDAAWGLTYSFQHDVNWERMGVPCKGLIDLLIINHSSNTIVLPNGFIFKPGDQVIVDIKTTSQPAYRCHEAIRKWRYDVQMAWYKEGLQHQLGEYDSDDIRCVLLFVSTLEEDTPVAFEMTPIDLQIAQWGAFQFAPHQYVPFLSVSDMKPIDIGDGQFVKPTINDVDVFGYEAMFDLYCRHEDIGVWDMPIELHLNKGLLSKGIWH